MTISAQLKEDFVEKIESFLKNYFENVSNLTDKQKKEFYGLYGDKIDKDTQDEEVYEFIAEAISSPVFQKFLSGIDSISSNPSVLKDIQNFFKAILDFIVKTMLSGCADVFSKTYSPSPLSDVILQLFNFGFSVSIIWNNSSTSNALVARSFCT